MEVKRVCQWCGKIFIAQKTTTCFCSHACASRGYKERIRERKQQLKKNEELMQIRQSFEGQDYFSFAQAAKLMGVSRQYIYKLVHSGKLRASRLSDRMAIIRRADIELMFKTNPYERLMPEAGFDIGEYYTAEQIVAKYKVGAKWVWTYTRKHKIPKVRIHQFNYYSRKHIDAAFAKYEVDSALTEWYTPEDIVDYSAGSKCVHIITQKTQTEDIIPIGEEALALIGGTGTGLVFKGLRQSWTQHPMKRWIRSAGIDKDITFHSYRRTFATLQAAAGTDLTTIRSMMAHKSITTTQRYIKTVDTNKREASNRITLTRKKEA